MIELACDCGRVFKVKDELAGKRGRCPECGAVIRVPLPAVVSPTVDADPIRSGISGRIRKASLPIAAVLLFVVAGQVVVIAMLERRLREGEAQIERLKAGLESSDETAERYAVQLLNMRNAADMARRVEAEVHRLEEEAGAPFGHKPETPEEREEQKRLAAGLQKIFDDTSRRIQGHQEYVTDAVKLPGNGNWLFKTQVTYEGYVTPDGIDMSGGTAEHIYAFNNGQLDDAGHDDGEFVWASQGTDAAAYHYGHANMPGAVFEVESVKSDQPGSLTAILRDQGTGEAKRLVVETYQRHHVEPIEE